MKKNISPKLTKYFLENYVGIQWASKDVTSSVVHETVCWQALPFNQTVMWKSPVSPSCWMWQALLLHLDMDGSCCLIQWYVNKPCCSTHSICLQVQLFHYLVCGKALFFTHWCVDKPYGITYLACGRKKLLLHSPGMWTSPSLMMSSSCCTSTLLSSSPEVRLTKTDRPNKVYAKYHRKSLQSSSENMDIRSSFLLITYILVHMSKIPRRK